MSGNFEISIFVAVVLMRNLKFCLLFLLIKSFTS